MRVDRATSSRLVASVMRSAVQVSLTDISFVEKYLDSKDTHRMRFSILACAGSTRRPVPPQSRPVALLSAP